MKRIAGMKKKFPAAAWILIAMVLGIIVGYMIFTQLPGQEDRRRRSPATSRSCPTCSCA